MFETTLMRFNISLIFILIFIYVLVNGYYSLRDDDFTKLTINIDTGFFMAILFIISLTLLPMPNQHPANPQINLIPFKTIDFFVYETDSISAIANILGNILLFVPFGYFAYIKFDEQIILSISLIIIFTVSIELVQLFIPARLSDVDDVILNTFGGIIGMLLAQFNLFIFGVIEDDDFYD